MVPVAETYDQGGDFAPALQGNFEGSTREPTQPPGAASTSGGDFLTGPAPPAPPQTAPDDSSPAPTDWSSVLGIYGMPPDIAAKVGQIFADNPDVNQAILLALAYIRGTDWYKQTYPGIAAGMANGLVSNERDYRAYVNEVKQYYEQYLGRDPTADEITQYMTNGTSAAIVGKTLEGNAYAQAYKPDIEYYAGAFGTGQLNQQQLDQYGQEKVGLGSQGGYALQNMIDQAIQRYKGAFAGNLAGPAPSLGPVGLAAPGLAGEKESLSKAPDVAAA